MTSSAVRGPVRSIAPLVVANVSRYESTAAVVSRITLTTVGQSLCGTSRHRVGRPGHARLARRCHLTYRSADLTILTWAASRSSAASTRSGWIEARKKGQLRCALFDEATEPTVEDGSVLGINVSLEAGVIEVLLEDEELTRVVAFPIDGELSVARLSAYLPSKVGDEHLNLRLRARLGSEFGVQNHGHVRLVITLHCYSAVRLTKRLGPPTSSVQPSAAFAGQWVPIMINQPMRVGLIDAWTM
jgi:hypothetical protein